MSATTLPTSSGSVDQRAAMSTGRAGCACQGNLCSSPPVYTVPHPLGGGRIRVSAQCKARLEGRESAWGPGEDYDPLEDRGAAYAQRAAARDGVTGRMPEGARWPRAGTRAAQMLVAIAEDRDPDMPRGSITYARKQLRDRRMLSKRGTLTKRGERAAARLRSAS